ncbi:Trp repressor binding protein [Galdieria sulphuraria]|uniref:Trp repressor binding protein n=1 Tax=Galdieria sulphuraria TaxID=130081 RepID=M2Y7S6_GALSU|nr:Trp repressor binding protein [Galdieria sulphuraria]EME31874.1 Trp repressor binding protein [Galdieria sulphuraria]|eukprot:XP_005708394.1 Trp repressor binding protein [Galdieria sulphuraria]
MSFGQGIGESLNGISIRLVRFLLRGKLRTLGSFIFETLGSYKMTKILVVYYSMYGHIKKMADQVVEGAQSEGCEVELYQVPETLSDDILKLLKAPPKPSDPVLRFELHDKLVEADAIIFGFPTRFGMMCAQMKAMFDSLGHLWQSGQLEEDKKQQL